MIVDAHCHIDAYPDPLAIAIAANQARVFTIAVTNSPSAFERAYPHVRPLTFLRLALGMHPLMVTSHKSAREWARFEANLARTSYVGEIGLDFSAEGKPTRDEQMRVFRRILEVVQRQPKFLTVHSRRAESAVLDLLEETGVGPVVLHWFIGSEAQLERALRGGHACSVNPAMLRSKAGLAVIERLPRDRVLTETDGPFVSVGGRRAQPGDVVPILEHLAVSWTANVEDVREQISTNLRQFVPATPGGKDSLDETIHRSGPRR